MDAEAVAQLPAVHFAAVASTPEQLNVRTACNPLSCSQPSFQHVIGGAHNVVDEMVPMPQCQGRGAVRTAKRRESATRAGGEKTRLQNWGTDSGAAVVRAVIHCGLRLRRPRRAQVRISPGWAGSTSGGCAAISHVQAVGSEVAQVLNPRKNWLAASTGERQRRTRGTDAKALVARVRIP